MKVTVSCALFVGLQSLVAAPETTTAAKAINALGVKLLTRIGQPDQNAVFSPYSIQSALTMTYAGAEGETREEMAAALHYPKDEAELHRSFVALRKALDNVHQRSAEHAEAAKRVGFQSDPITLMVANRLFGQMGYDIRPSFLAIVKSNYDAPFVPLDFNRDPAGATTHINTWVEDQTRQRIRGVIPESALPKLTRLVLVNAIYLKAPWMHEFDESGTKALPFHLAGSNRVDVPTMTQELSCRYAKCNGFSVLLLPYKDEEIQFLVLLPDKVNGLAEVEGNFVTNLLSRCPDPEWKQVRLYLPKLKLDPPLLWLSRELQAIGVKSAFDNPAGSANFDRIAPRQSSEALFLSEVFHKAFLHLDEKGTEAAAATAAAAWMRGGSVKPRPIEVRVDRPFLFAIQHQPSGACLFLGRVTDPR